MDEERDVRGEIAAAEAQDDVQLAASVEELEQRMGELGREVILARRQVQELEHQLVMTGERLGQAKRIARGNPPGPDPEAQQQLEQEWDRKRYGRWRSNIKRAIRSGSIHRETARMVDALLHGAEQGLYPSFWPEKRGGMTSSTRRVTGEIEALVYVKVCRGSGKSPVVSDRSPVKTIIQEYGIDRRTYQNWQRELRGHPDLSQASLNAWVDFPNGGRDWVRQQMLNGAAAYRSRKVKRAPLPKKSPAKSSV